MLMVLPRASAATPVPEEPMSRSRASLRIVLALGLLLTMAAPVSARDISVVVQTSSPTQVTAGYPVAYPVAVTNTSRSSVNHVSLSGNAPSSFTYLGSSSPACSTTDDVCEFGQLAAGASLPVVRFYYRTPTTPATYQYTATVSLNEGPNDSPGNDPAVEDSFTSAPIETQVVPADGNLATGHAFGSFRSFSTGLANLGISNPHGSAVTVPATGEVRVQDLAPSAAPACPAAASTCFGWATQLSVANGASFPAGIEVTVRWDASQLPSGMTDRKLRIIHLFDGGGYELVSNACTFAGGQPTNLPCVKSAPKKQADKDIQATILLLRNGFVRGW